MPKKFTRRIEDFICGHCGAAVTGQGYTNHCPVCLWSRHVDVNPGDRAATCGGLMEPVGLEMTRKGYILNHRCQKCGHTMRCRTDAADDSQALVDLARRLARGHTGQDIKS